MTLLLIGKQREREERENGDRQREKDEKNDANFSFFLSN
jgi:hypothetical protein